jgi:hypothetical protein
MSSSPNPLVTVSTTNNYGNKIELFSRSQIAQGGPQHSATIDFVSITSSPALSIYTAIELGFFTQSNMLYQIQSSPDLSTWTNFDSQIQGTGSNWFKTYSIRGQPQSFYRVQVVP